jgi:hypothetical protein
MKWNDCNLIIFGIVMGAVLGATVLEALALPNTLYLGSNGRLQWETLITGFAAVLAAGGTIFMLNRKFFKLNNLLLTSGNDERGPRAQCFRSHFRNSPGMRQPAYKGFTIYDHIFSPTVL